MLPIKVVPNQNELFSSWLRRLAHHNGTDIKTFSELIFGNARLLIKDIDKSLTLDEINKIASFTGITSEIIEKMSLYYILSKITSNQLNHKFKWIWLIPNGARYKHKINGLQFCPLCLKENNQTFQIFNRLSWNFACIKHQVLLHSSCPKCNYQYSPSLKLFQSSIKHCTRCDYDLSTIATDKVNQKAFKLQTFLNACIEKDTIDNDSYALIDKTLSELFFTIRTFIRFFLGINRKEYIMAKLSEELNTTIDFSFHTTHGDSFDKLPTKHRMEIFENIAILLELDLSTIKSIFTYSNITYGQFLGSNSIIPHSPTTKDIANSVKYRTNAQRTNPSHKLIKPRSIKEVDLLMDEIEQYLWN
jgi:hypothetical protein